ncbi:MAG: Mur ligase family protein, partial [Candidatus Uhrbacteria bacterium]|nr:Mur ligase family protein [Candidatus Uhrbacteria bacterium]
RDHLNTYPSMKEYAEAKAQIFRHQKSQDVVFFPNDHHFDQYAKQAHGQAYRFGKKGSLETRLVKSAKLKLLGEHNIKNAEAAVAVALKFGVDQKTIKRALESFSGLPDRLETVAVKKGVRYINDTTATTPDATIAAIQSVIARSHTTKQSPRSHLLQRRTHLRRGRLPRSQSLTRNDNGRIHLIFGGADKELKFDEVARIIKHGKISVTLLPGTARAKIIKAFRSAGVIHQDAKDLKSALLLIRQNLKFGDIVLLSPGCASFGLFKNEYDRGEKFKKLLTHF